MQESVLSASIAESAVLGSGCGGVPNSQLAVTISPQL